MVTGSCLCKGYRFEVSGEFENMMDCFCSICRKAHGAAYATFVGCKGNQYSLLQGEELVAKFKSSEKGHRAFCKVCGSSLPLVFGEKVFIPAGLLDGDPGVRTSAHIFVGSKADWVEINDDAPQFETYPSS